MVIQRFFVQVLLLFLTLLCLGRPTLTSLLSQPLHQRTTLGYVQPIRSRLKNFGDGPIYFSLNNMNNLE